jgi:hypothetical protein
MPLEILHVALVLLGRRPRPESAEVAALAGFRIHFTGVETVFAGLQFTYHKRASFNQTPYLNRDGCGLVPCPDSRRPGLTIFSRLPEFPAADPDAGHQRPPPPQSTRTEGVIEPAITSQTELFCTPHNCYKSDMTTAEEIEKAIEQLAPRELARFRAWFETFDTEQFDAAIERDVREGKLDVLGDEALAAHRAGRSRDL